MATYLKSTNNEQSINVVLSHLRSNFVDMLCRKCPEEEKKRQEMTHILIYLMSTLNYSMHQCLFLFLNALLLCLTGFNPGLFGHSEIIAGFFFSQDFTFWFPVEIHPVLSILPHQPI